MAMDAHQELCPIWFSVRVWERDSLEPLPYRTKISRNKSPYYVALEAADMAFANGQIDVDELERLLKSLIANQLASVLKAASETGRRP